MPLHTQPLKRDAVELHELNAVWSLPAASPNQSDAQSVALGEFDTDE